MPWVVIEVWLSSSAPCSEQLLLGSISTPQFLQSKSQELLRYSNSKVLPVWWGPFALLKDLVIVALGLGAQGRH